MKTIKNWMVGHACEKTAHSTRIALHVLAFLTGHEKLNRAWVGILRELPQSKK